MVTMGFQTLFEIDTNPGGTANWVRLGAGIESATPALNETLVQRGYLDGNGGQSTRTTGFQLVYTFSGERRPGDTAQDYIYNKMLELGDNRMTQFRATDAGGAVITGPCSIANITPPGGNANDISAFSFEIHFNGKPTLTPAALAAALTATFGAGTAPGTTKVTATPTGTNTLAYKITKQAITVYGRQYVDGVIAYTSGSDIAGAVADDYLNVYELDQYMHVVKFASKKLVAGDFAP